MPDSGKEGAALMLAVKGGDEGALSTLVTQWQEPLLRFVYRYVQSEADARELVHETFVRAYVNRASFRDGASFSGWIFTIAANLARNHLRGARRRAGGVGATREANSVREAVCPQPSPDHSALASERLAAVRAAIDDLPHDLKTTLLLFEYEDLGYAEIATVVGCSVKGVEARLRRARDRLRRALEPFLAASPSLTSGATAPAAP